MDRRYSGKQEEPILVVSETPPERSETTTHHFSLGLDPIMITDPKGLTIASTLGNHFIKEDEEEGFASGPFRQRSGVSKARQDLDDDVEQTQNPTEKFNSMAKKFKNLTQSLKMNMKGPSLIHDSLPFDNQFDFDSNGLYISSQSKASKYQTNSMHFFIF